MTTLGMSSATVRSFTIEFRRSPEAQWHTWDGSWSGPMDSNVPEEAARKALKGYLESDPDLEFRLVRINSTSTTITEVVG